MEEKNNKIIYGRPDMQDHSFGISRAKRHPKYVYSATFGCLVHEVRYIEFRWYEILSPGNKLRWLDSPRISATTKCGQNFFISKYHTSFRGTRRHSKVCNIPDPNAVMCKKCQGEGVNFPRGREWEVSKQEAKARLGCNDIINI